MSLLSFQELQRMSTARAIQKMHFLAAIVLALSVALASCDYDTYFRNNNLPDPNNRPAMARFIVNNANYTSFGYITADCGAGGKGCPNNALFATSDGPLGCGKGIPYFFSSRHHPTVVELMDKDPRGAIVMSLAQTDICRQKGWDPQDPRCAHVTIFGNFVVLNEKDPEYAVAKAALLGRHPQFSYYPSGHKFFFAKLAITKIGIINTFGGPVDINLDEYYKIKMC